MNIDECRLPVLVLGLNTFTSQVKNRPFSYSIS